MESLNAATAVRRQGVRKMGCRMKQQRLPAPLHVLQNFIRSVYREGLDTVPGATDAASNLFREIERHHGLAKARRIFAKLASPPTARRLTQIKNESLLNQLDMMKPEPDVHRLAWKLAEENKALPREQRHGPRGSTNPATLDKHIRRLRDKRDNRRGWCDFPRYRASGTADD